MAPKPLIIALIFTGLSNPLWAAPPEKNPLTIQNPSTQPTKPANDGNSDHFDVALPTQVQVQVEFVEMTHESLTKLLFMAKPTTSDATKLRQQVQEMITKDEAKVLETQILVSRSGQKATTEAIHEYIYPTEYEPPSLVADTNGKPEPKTTKSTAPIPTAFETRNLGSTIEIEPIIADDGKQIDLRLIPELVWHPGNTIYHEGKDLAGNPFQITMPDLCTLRLNTRLILISGQYTLAGTVSPKDAKGQIDLTRKVMVFVKGDILTVK